VHELGADGARGTEDGNVEIIREGAELRHCKRVAARPCAATLPLLTKRG
jgi:hypothetical protein